MDGARDIVLISFPFAVGVFLAQYCPARLFQPSLALVCVLILPPLAGRFSIKCWYALLYLALGLFCGAAGNLFPPPARGEGFFGRALETTISRIRALPLAHGRSRELLCALLTGSREGLSPETVQAFRAAGASHILALSGLHLGIIYLLVGKALSFTGNARAGTAARSILTVAISAFYALMTGASPSIVRALLFITINEIMRHSPGRKKDPLSVWCCALMIQLTVSPWVIKSVGFQLSYLAMLGIFLVYPRLEALYPKPEKGWSPMRWIWNSMALSLACQVFTAPLVWKVFHSFPKYFLLTNLLALPLTSALMISAVTLLLLSFAGICPQWLLQTTDTLAEVLQRCLNIIAGM